MIQRPLPLMHFVLQVWSTNMLLLHAAQRDIQMGPGCQVAANVVGLTSRIWHPDGTCEHETRAWSALLPSIQDCVRDGLRCDRRSCVLVRFSDVVG